MSAPSVRTGMSGVTIRVDLVDGRLKVSGDLDRRTAHCLLDAISTLQFAGLDEWVLDLTDLGFSTKTASSPSAPPVTGPRSGAAR